MRDHDPNGSSFQIRGTDEGTIDSPRAELTSKSPQAADATLVVAGRDASGADTIARDASHIVGTRKAHDDVEGPELRENISPPEVASG